MLPIFADCALQFLAIFQHRNQVGVANKLIYMLPSEI